VTVLAESTVNQPVADSAGLNRWTVAAADTRTTARWLMTSLGAAAALIFGAGPIVNRPELSWSTDGLQLIIALVAGACGLVCLIALIGQIATVLVPRKISLEAIPSEMVKDLDAGADVRLPSGSGSYADFLKRYRRYQVLVGTLSARLSRLDDGPTADIERAQLITLLDEAQRNVAVYSRAADGLLNQSEFYSVSGLFNAKHKQVIVLAALAALGALSFQLALAADPEKSPQQDFEVAYLKVPSVPNTLWTDLELESCVLDDGVPVVISGGNGSDSDPYAVTVLKSKESCVPTSFDLRADALTVEKPVTESVTVNYTR